MCVVVCVVLSSQASSGTLQNRVWVLARLGGGDASEWWYSKGAGRARRPCQKLRFLHHEPVRDPRRPVRRYKTGGKDDNRKRTPGGFREPNARVQHSSAHPETDYFPPFSRFFWHRSGGRVQPTTRASATAVPPRPPFFSRASQPFAVVTGTRCLVVTHHPDGRFRTT